MSLEVKSKTDHLIETLNEQMKILTTLEIDMEFYTQSMILNPNDKQLLQLKVRNERMLKEKKRIIDIITKKLARVQGKKEENKN